MGLRRGDLCRTRRALATTRGDRSRARLLMRRHAGTVAEGDHEHIRPDPATCTREPICALAAAHDCKVAGKPLWPPWLTQLANILVAASSTQLGCAKPRMKPQCPP